MWKSIRTSTVDTCQYGDALSRDWYSNGTRCGGRGERSSMASVSSRAPAARKKLNVRATAAGVYSSHLLNQPPPSASIPTRIMENLLQVLFFFLI